MPGFSHYEASSEGRVRSLTRKTWTSNGHERIYQGRVLSARTDRHGYQRLNLCESGIITPHSVHHLVAAAFHGEPPEGFQVCHNNGVPDDNRAVNLRWDSASGNILDAVQHGTHVQTRRTHCPRNHLLAAPNLSPAKARLGHRYCRACDQAKKHVNRLRSRGHEPPTLQAESDRRYRQILEAARQ